MGIRGRIGGGGARGAPDILVFRNISPAAVELRDPEARGRSLAQLDALDAFWKRYFADRGVFLAASAEYREIEEFAARLEELLRKLIERRIKSLAAGGPPDTTPSWLGNPFRGLAAYEFEHAAIFFGRDALVAKAAEQLAAQARAGAAFLLVVGGSGAGKSSLVKEDARDRCDAAGARRRTGSRHDRARRFDRRYKPARWIRPRNTRLRLRPDGKSLYVAAAKDILSGQISVLDSDTLAPQRTFGRLTGGARHLAIAPNAKWLAVHGIIGIDFFDVQTGERMVHMLTGRDAMGGTVSRWLRIIGLHRLRCARFRAPLCAGTGCRDGRLP